MTAAVFYVCVGHTTDATNGVNQGLVASRSGSQIKGAARCAHTTLYLVSYLSPGADTHRPPPCRSCPSRRCAPDARPGCRATAPGQSSHCRQGETEAGISLQIVMISWINLQPWKYSRTRLCTCVLFPFSLFFQPGISLKKGASPPPPPTHPPPPPICL